jgi:hypothetical protein
MAGGGVLEVVFVHVGIHPHPVLEERLMSAEPGSGVRMKNSSKSTGNSRCTVRMSRAICSGVSPGKPPRRLWGMLIQ